jgi:two-component system cell cycle sensor histidine kinase/response regulator CckA
LNNTDQRPVFQQNHLYPEAFEASGDVLCELVPASGEIIWHLRENQQFLKYSKNELFTNIAQLRERVFGHDEKAFEANWVALESKQSVDFCCRLMDKDNFPAWSRVLVVPSSTDPTRSLIILRNLQDFREEADQIAEARRVQSIETMAAGIAHEFNNNLTPIRGFIELALEYLGDDHPVFKGLQTALSRVEYSASLVEQIQLYGRKTLLNPRPVDFGRVLQSMIRVAISLEGEKTRNIKLHSEIDPALPTVWIDQARLRQAFVQLVKNAVEAMPEGGTLTLRAKTILVEDTEGSAHSGDFVQIQMSDSGTGISQEDLAHIFDPFFTTHGRANAKGMGLSMVQGMVAQHGGWVEIRSDLNQGTDVRIFLPIRDEDQSSLDPENDNTMKVIPAADVGKLLIADDEDYIRHLISKVFSAEGWAIDEAHDNSEAIELMEQHPDYYDLLIIDITMPGPTTEEALQRIIKASPKTCILIVSGHARDERVEALLEMGAADYVSKPFSPRGLLAKVDEIM